MSRRYAFLMLIAVCLTATMALADETSAAAPSWWPTFTFSDEKPQSNHDAPAWWPVFVPKEAVLNPLEP